MGFLLGYYTFHLLRTLFAGSLLCLRQSPFSSPNGLASDMTTGLLSGTPQTAGTYPIQIAAMIGGGIASNQEDIRQAIAYDYVPRRTSPAHSTA